ncbi:unnamed protein product [Medioppia subpectinata]|uniref:Uncharacterized protein n=1 Tax=Medioppia subpectinata TaxID=1979941 RepID=A0A7R9KJK9_9ACAR|nr:unnamed protein product [Medioppia subpectinata]CAG2104458.1 unnamed protein product [Medioppia subpectinata]
MYSEVNTGDTEDTGTQYPVSTTTPTNTSGTQSSFLSSKPIYETLDEMLVRVNDLFDKKPINGRVLSVETVPIPVECNNFSVDTEQSYWSDECQKNNNSVFILRIYFEYGNTARERLEIIDFIPRVQIWDAPLAVPIYESFSRGHR